MKDVIKTKKISTVCSNKQDGHTIHKLRFDFTKLIEKEIPELQRFGRGFRWIETKVEALDDYEFHVDGQLRTISKDSLLDADTLCFYKENFKQLIKGDLSNLSAIKQKHFLAQEKIYSGSVQSIPLIDVNSEA